MDTFLTITFIPLTPCSFFRFNDSVRDDQRLSNKVLEKKKRYLETDPLSVVPSVSFWGKGSEGTDILTRVLIQDLYSPVTTDSKDSFTEFFKWLSRLPPEKRERGRRTKKERILCLHYHPRRPQWNTKTPLELLSVPSVSTTFPSYLRPLPHTGNVVVTRWKEFWSKILSFCLGTDQFQQ